jgi:hypothetical protein
MHPDIPVDTTLSSGTARYVYPIVFMHHPPAEFRVACIGPGTLPIPAPSSISILAAGGYPVCLGRDFVQNSLKAPESRVLLFVSFPRARLTTATLVRSFSFTTSTASHHLLVDMDTITLWNIVLFEGGRVDDVLGPLLDGSLPSHLHRVSRCCIRCDCLEAPCYV